MDSSKTIVDSTVLGEVSSLLWKIGIPLVVTAGTFGNIMVLVIQRRLKDTSVTSLSMYFTCLSVSDLFALWLDPVLWFLNAFDVFLNFEELCKTRVFIGYLTAQTSPMILVAMTFQRAASILLPLRVGFFCNERFTRVVLVSIFVFFILLNSHVLYGHTLLNSDENQTAECYFSYVSKEYKDFFRNRYGWINISLSSLIPFCLLAASNAVLIWKLNKSLRETRQKMSLGRFSQIQTRQNQSSSLTLTLIATSLAFFVLTLPLSICLVYVEKFSIGAGDNQDASPESDLMLTATGVLYFSNSAINFYVYCLTGSKYRYEFAKIFCCQK